MIVSIIIRTLNEEKYLEELIRTIHVQHVSRFTYEIVLVDSGSTDKTISIAQSYDVKITHISKEDFSFGRALNVGCEFSSGDYLVFISGHCIPTDRNWLSSLVEPLIDNQFDYVYGKQIGRDTTKFSEEQVFKRYFPSDRPSNLLEYFCNNANAAIKRKVWEKYKFNEQLTGLEDMFLAKQVIDDDGQIGYVPSSTIYHIHDETWSQVMRRYYREALALQFIDPALRVTIFDSLYYTCTSTYKDLAAAFKQKCLLGNIIDIFRFRFCQYYGIYKGNHRKNNRYIHMFSKNNKRKYFYPDRE
jgi:glycosyltransferase involved in cell wall biosynthesis